jgi:hypothetical protein
MSYSLTGLPSINLKFKYTKLCFYLLHICMSFNASVSCLDSYYSIEADPGGRAV